MSVSPEAVKHHPILDLVLSINKDMVEEGEWDAAPHDRQEFLDWWWATYGVNCERCVLSVGRNLVVKPDGYVGDGRRPMIMIVGEGPGALEDATGLPMVSPMVLRSSRCGVCARAHDCFSHKLLPKPNSRHPKNKPIVCRPQPTDILQLRERFYIQSAGSVVDGILMSRWKFNYPRQSWLDLYNRLHPEAPMLQGSPWFITNTVLCRSADPLTHKDTSPGTAPKSICKKWLVWQWAAVQPKITICFGLPALEALTQGKERSQIVAGEIFHTAKFGPIIFHHHPAHLMREENATVQALNFAKIADVFRKALEYAGYPTD